MCTVSLLYEEVTITILGLLMKVLPWWLRR